VTPELSIILPVRNQADYITALIERYLKEFHNRPWEIILVPNASSDDSFRLCKELEEKYPNISLVENPLGGWGLSVRVGLQSARGQYLCYTNSARTNPATITLLFDRILSQPGSLAKISRYSRGDFFRELGTMIYNFECRTLFGFRCRDVNGTPKIFPREFLDQMKLSSDGDLLDAEILAWCQRFHIPILEEPLGGWGRHGGKSTTGLKSAARMYLGVIRLWLKLR
jgi:hypothetical protein